MYNNYFIPQLFRCNYFDNSLASRSWRGRATDHQTKTQQQHKQKDSRNRAAR